VSDSRLFRRKAALDVVDISERKACSINAPKVAVDMRKYNQEHRFLFDESFGHVTSNDEVQ